MGDLIVSRRFFLVGAASAVALAAVHPSAKLIVPRAERLILRQPLTQSLRLFSDITFSHEEDYRVEFALKRRASDHTILSANVGRDGAYRWCSYPGEEIPAIDGSLVLRIEPAASRVVFGFIYFDMDQSNRRGEVWHDLFERSRNGQWNTKRTCMRPGVPSWG